MILFYEDIFDCPEELEAAEKAGFEVRSFNIKKNWAGDLPSKNFIFRGSLEGLAWLDRVDHPYYCKLSNIENYAISDYVWGFAERFLNNDFILLPAGKIRESKDMLFDLFGGDRIFIKPNNGDKLFTGTYLTKKWFDKDLNIVFHELSRSDVMLSDILFLSSYKEVGEEVRYVVNDNKIISDVDYPDWLENIVKDCFINDPFYTVDVCEDKIVEVNCMSCSGLNDSFDKVYRNLYDYFNEET